MNLNGSQRYLNDHYMVEQNYLHEYANGFKLIFHPLVIWNDFHIRVGPTFTCRRLNSTEWRVWFAKRMASARILCTDIPVLIMISSLLGVHITVVLPSGSLLHDGWPHFTRNNINKQSPNLSNSYLKQRLINPADDTFDNTSFINLKLIPFYNSNFCTEHFITNSEWTFRRRRLCSLLSKLSLFQPSFGQESLNTSCWGCSRSINLPRIFSVPITIGAISICVKGFHLMEWAPKRIKFRWS